MNFTPESKVHLLENVPFSNYKHIRLFDNKTEQINYFQKFIKKSETEFKYQRINSNKLRFKVECDEISKVNYMMFQNSKYSTKWFYAFITSINYINAGVTEVNYEIDVMQTWMFDFNMRASYIEREHTQRFQNGKPVINTIDEGLGYGSDYQIVKQDRYVNTSGNTNVLWVVFVLRVSGNFSGSIHGVSNSLKIVFAPFYKQPSTSVPKVFKWGEMVIDDANEMMSILTKSETYVNSVVNAYLTYDLPINYTLTTNGNTINFLPSDVDTVSTEQFYDPAFGTGAKICLSLFGTTVKKTISCGNKYQNFSYEESKLYMYPYSLIEISNNRGEVFTIKPENITGDNLNIQKIILLGNLPKIAYLVQNYNSSLNLLDYGIIESDTNDLPVVDDYTSAYLQANKNQITAQQTFIVDNAQRGISQNNQANYLFNAKINMAQGNSGDKLLDFFKMAQVATSNIFNSANSFENTQWARTIQNQANDFQNENIQIGADQQIALNEAKMNDINNVPPTVSKMGGNSLFDFIHDYYGLYVTYKTIKPEYANKLTSYFKMFGYKVNDVKIPNLKSRVAWNYIKTISCEIEASIPQNHINILKSIFDNGTTFWHNDNIKDYTKPNNER